MLWWGKVIHICTSPNKKITTQKIKNYLEKQRWRVGCAILLKQTIFKYIKPKKFDKK